MQPPGRTDRHRPRRIVLLGTGGTIASTGEDSGGAVARLTAKELLGGTAAPEVQVETQDVLTLGSYLLEHRHLRQIAEAVAAALAREDVDGVVVTHGTDTLEETAFMLSVVHQGEKPVVLTGAQRSADQPDGDGPRNLRDALVVAASPHVQGLGVLVVFSGLVFPGARVRKAHTVAPQPFTVADGGPLGTVEGAGVRVHTRPVLSWPPLELRRSFDSTRADVVVLHPGADDRLARAAVEAGARAVVLGGTGAGNANHAVLRWVEEAVAAGSIVGLSSRVMAGPVLPLYANGGAVDLLAAGALDMGALPLYHSRLLLALLAAPPGEPVDQGVVDHYC